MKQLVQLVEEEIQNGLPAFQAIVIKRKSHAGPRNRAILPSTDQNIGRGAVT